MQWGFRQPGGYVTFPIKFTSFSHALCTHNGKEFRTAKCDSDNPLTGATFMATGDSPGNDCHYIVIGI